MNDDLKIGLAGTEEILKMMEDLIKKDWIVLDGDMDFYKKIEDEIYTPGSGRNKYFLLINFSWAGKITVIVLIKKIKELKKFLNMEKQHKDFKSLISIRLAQSENVGAAAELIFVKDEEEKNFFAYNYLNNLMEYMEKGEVTREQIHAKDYSKKPKKQPKKRKTISKSIRHEVFKRDEYKCVECGATKEETTLHIDHIIPLSQGGTDEMDNLQTLCEACNLAKSNRKWKGGN